MVMHARKPQRISDGYFEKHQAHPYQKYNSKNERRANEYISVDGRYPQVVSPNGNVAHSSHGHHHYVHCADRHYQRAAWPLPKQCDKERDRDYKPSRDKYTDNVSKRSKDSERERSNHERIEAEKKNRSSGVNSSSVNKSNKYNKRSGSRGTPAGSEWSEHISSSGKRYYYNAISEVSQWEKPRDWDLRQTSSKDSSTYSSSRTNHEKRSDSRTGKYPEKCSKRTNSNSQRYWNSNSGRDEDGQDRNRPKRSSAAHEDMEISPDRSPVSENSYRVPRESTSTSVRNPVPGTTNGPPVVIIDKSTQQGGSLLAAALPRIVSTPMVTASVNSAPKAGSPPREHSPGGTPHRDAGPPTPTHSENIDPHAPPIHLENALPRRMESLGSYSSVVGSMNLHQAPPMLTPSLVNSVRADLTGHVVNWPADILERQANKYSDEAYHLGCLQCTRVSAELKCSRSLVRHTEIQATLQEQKIMYLRQQITRLDELRSQNTFMCDD